MDSLTERIDLINDFKFIERSRNEEVDMHLQSNFYILLLNCIAFSITFIIVLLAAITAIFRISIPFNWDKTSLLVLLSINSINTFGNTLNKRITLKHLKFLETAPVKPFNQKLNNDLADLAAKLYRPLWRKLIIAALTGIILIACIINLFMDYQFIYYKFLIIPTLLFYVLATLNIWGNYKKLKANINEVEQSQHSVSPI